MCWNTCLKTSAIHISSGNLLMQLLKKDIGLEDEIHFILKIIFLGVSARY